MPTSVSAVLKTFFGECFHPDWDRRSPDWREALHRYLAERPERDCIQIGAELAETLDDTKFRDEDFEHLLFDRYGCYFDPRPAQTPRAWLETILETIQEKLDEPQPSATVPPR